MAFVAGIDFGTTNSSTAISNGDAPKMVKLEQSFDTIPTALYFPNNKPGVYFGRDALARAVDNESITGYDDKEDDNGRFMRSIKRALGTNLMPSGLGIGRHQVRQQCFQGFRITLRRFIDSLQ